MDTATGLPLAWEVRTAKDAEATVALPLLDATLDRGFAVETCAMDKGYDNGPIHDGCEDRDVRPIIPLRQTTAVKRGDHKPPTCEHGEWRFAGADYGRKATKWRCPTGECQPASVWVKADRLHPLIPRETLRFKALYKKRGAVEREFGRLKHEWALAPLRVRGIERVRLHADLTILAKLSCALSKAQAVPLAAQRSKMSAAWRYSFYAMARRSRTRAEARARYYIRAEAEQRGWNLAHVDSGGDTVEENEIVAQFPKIGLGLNKPDFLMCFGGEPAVVVEAKNESGKLDKAITEAIEYADEINAAGHHRIVVAVGAAGTDDTGLDVAVRFLAGQEWVPLKSLDYELTAFPSHTEVELAIAADDGTTTVTVPEQSEFVDAAIELSAILRSAKVEAPLRPKVMGAIVMAMYEGDIDVTPENALGSVNELAERGISQSHGMSEETKSLLVDTLRLTTADFDRLAPSIRRIVSILRRLNVRAVLQTDTDFLGMFYEAFLRYGYDNNALGIVFTPRHITRLCVDLIGTRPTDRVIDVASGTGGFLVAAFDKMMTERQPPEAVKKIKESVFGFEINPTVWALSVLNMFFRGDGKSHMERGDCLTPEARRAVRRSFTRAFLNPPFSQEDEPEVDFIDAALNALEPEGQLAAVVKAGIFADDRNKDWRERFLKRHTLLGVISLPEDLFYPTAAPTSIVIARAHVPHPANQETFMARVWNDGFEKLKSRRVECAGSQLPEIVESYYTFTDGERVTSDLAVVIDARALADGAEWSPQQHLPQPHATAAEVDVAQEAVLRSIFQATGRFPDLADEVLPDFADAWSGLPGLPVNGAHPVSHYFDVGAGKSTGEKNYADGSTPYISSGDASNSIVRLVAEDEEESFGDGALTVTAFGAAAVQPWPFMARGNGGSAVRVLTPRFNMSVRELIWFAAQINLHRWRFFYARMAIKGRISRLEVQSPHERLPDGEGTIAADVQEFHDMLDRVSRSRLLV